MTLALFWLATFILTSVNYATIINWVQNLELDESSPDLHAISILSKA